MNQKPSTWFYRMKNGLFISKNRYHSRPRSMWYLQIDNDAKVSGTTARSSSVSDACGCEGIITFAEKLPFMEKPGENIEHPGVIENIIGKKIWVSIMPQSACGNCHSKSYCGMAEMAEKIIEVATSDHEGTYKVGQKVTVQLRKSLGYKALLLGYLLPFLIILLTLITTLEITNSELVSALVSISVVAPYYYILYLNRKKIRTSFRFFITG